MIFRESLGGGLPGEEGCPGFQIFGRYGVPLAMLAGILERVSCRSVMKLAHLEQAHVNEAILRFSGPERMANFRPSRSVKAFDLAALDGPAE